MLEVDVETTGLQAGRHDLFLVQFYDGTATWVIPFHTDWDDQFGIGRAQRNHARQEIQDFLDAAPACGGLRAWNSKFDFGFLEANGLKLPADEWLHDGMVLAHIIDERSSAALKARGELLFGSDERDLEGEVKAWLTAERKRRRKVSKETGREYRPPNYRDVPDKLMRDYGVQDVVLQKKVCDVYERELANEPKLAELYELERGVLGALFRMERRGVPVNRDAAVKFEAEILDGLDALTEKCFALSGKSNFNPNAPRQVEEALERRGVDLSAVPTSEKSGAKSMAVDVLSGLDDELAQAVLEWRNSKKQLGTYLIPMLHGKDDPTWGFQYPFIADDGRIRPQFRQVGAVTGRMSCSMPNLQNWHRDDLRMRYMVQAPKGYKLVCVDLDAIEMKLFAAFAGAGAMLELVRDPEGDPHSYTAQQVGIRDMKRPDGSVTSARTMAKIFNFSMIYGGGGKTVQTTFGVTAQEARAMIHAYHEAYPEIGQLQERVEYKLETKGYITTPWGRRHRVRNKWQAREEGYKFPNKLVQGTAADLIKDALVKVHRAAVPLILIVHDELISLSPEHEAEEHGEIMRQALIDHPRITKSVPLEAEVQIVDNWSDAKEPGFVPDYMRR